MISNATVIRRLWIVLVMYETLVIAIVAGAGLNIAMMGGGSIAMAAPLLLISYAEALRIPLSALATRLRWGGQVLAAVALLAIAVGSAEGLAVAFEAFLQNRVVDIMRANGAVDRAQRAVDQAASERTLNEANVASFASAVTALDAQVAALAKSIPQPPAGSNRTCTWRGQRVSCSADTAAIGAYREALKAYDARLESLTGQRSSLQAKGGCGKGETGVSGLPGGSWGPSGGETGLRGEGQPVAGLSIDRRGVRRARFRRDADPVRAGQSVRDRDAGDRVRDAQHGGEHCRTFSIAQRSAEQASARLESHDRGSAEDAAPHPRNRARRDQGADCVPIRARRRRHRPSRQFGGQSHSAARRRA